MRSKSVLTCFLITLLTVSCSFNQLYAVETLIPVTEVSKPEYTQTPKTEVATPIATPGVDLLSNFVDHQTDVPGEFSEDTFLFEKQPGTPLSTVSWLYGCEWFGIAGQVFNYDGHPMEFLIIEAGGTLDGQPVLGLSLAGTIFEYGPGGYEITLSDHPIQSSGTLWIQLKDLAGVSLSPKIYVNTTSDCSQNLTLLNFLHTGYSEPVVYYYPLIFR